jgi:cyclophilin family peptidyl-prolyl cis-trans isomerase/HEAT repeat protein
MNRYAVAALAALALVSACATLPPPEAFRDPLDAAATLLRLEDRREYDEAVLHRAASAPRPEVRRAAALAAGRIRDPRAVPLLGGLLADPDTAVAATAAFALGHVGDTAAVPLLVPYAASVHLPERATVAGEAAYALGKLGGPAAVAAIRELAFEGVGRPGDRDAIGSALLGAARFPRWDDLSVLMPAMQSPDAALRWRAAYVLSRRPSAVGTGRLTPLARDAEPLVRQQVVRALTQPLVDSAAIERDQALDLLLAAAATDADPGVRVNAIRSIGTFESPRAVAVLEALLAAEDPYLAITAAESLGRLRAAAAHAAEPLARVAADGRRPVALRIAALAALPDVDRARAEAAAAALAGSSEWRVRAAAARAYGALGPAERPELAALADDPDRRVAAAAVGAVAAAADTVDVRPAARERLRAALAHADPVVRANALGGFARLRDPETLPLLLDAFDAARRDTVRNAALAAVSAIGAVHARDPAAGAAFFRRFERSPDYLVRAGAREAFGEALAAAWGPVHPIDTGLAPADYRRIAAEAAGPLPRARIVTDAGEIEVELFAPDAPLTVRNFLALTAAGYFDGQEWPRVVPNFVIQGGDPRGDTSGGPGYSIRDEMNRHRYGRGTLGMALSGPDTGGSQWFITHAPQPHLDGGYTVFGRVVRGMEVVDRVLPGDRIIRIEEVR